jgi:hypothetical protein
MAIKPEEAKVTLVERAIAHVRERLSVPRATEVEWFVREYYADAAPEDLAELDLYGAALAHWHLLQLRRPREAKVRVYTPDLEEHGWQSTHSVVEIVTDDMPFLVDSVTMVLTRHGSSIHVGIHPILSVRRDDDWRLVERLPREAEGVAESLIHIEIDRQADQAFADELAGELRRVLADVHAAVEDWPAMRDRIREIGAELAERPPSWGCAARSRSPWPLHSRTRPMPALRSKVATSSSSSPSWSSSLLQGLSLPFVIRSLGLTDDRRPEEEELRPACTPRTRRSPGSRSCWTTGRSRPRTPCMSVASTPHAVIASAAC